MTLFLINKNKIKWVIPGVHERKINYLKKKEKEKENTMWGIMDDDG